MPIYTQGLRVRQGQTLEEYPSSFGEYLGAKVEQAWTDSAIDSVQRNRELTEAESGEEIVSASATARFGMLPQRGAPDSPIIDQSAAMGRIKEAGLEGRLKAPEGGIRERALSILIQRKHDEIRRQDAIQRAPNKYAVAGLPAAIAVGLLDPINLAASFVPVVGEAKWASIIARSGTAARVGYRAARGTAEGIVGSALVEPIVYSAHAHEQADYSMLDSLTNVTFGGLLGGGLHVVGGAVSDRFGRTVPRETDGGLAETISINTPERQAFRDGLVSAHLATSEPVDGRAPVAYVMGGGGGAGKGTILRLLRDEGAIPSKNVVHIDPDEIKLQIPEYGEGVAKGDKTAAARVHEESSVVGKRILAEGIAGRRDIILDRTLSKRTSGLADLEQLRNAGYDIRLVGVTVDVEEAVRRAMKRAERSGRHVPETALREAHAGFAANFAEYADLADEARLFDNTGDAPLLIASKDAGGRLEIRNTDAYTVFAERGVTRERLGQKGRQGANRPAGRGTNAEGAGSARGGGAGAAPAVPETAAEIAAAANWPTRAAAVQVSVAQALDGRTLDVEPVFTGAEMDAAVARQASAESSITADPASSRAADALLEEHPTPSDPDGLLAAVDADLADELTRLKDSAKAAGLEDADDFGEYDAAIADAERYGSAARAAALCLLRS